MLEGQEHSERIRRWGWVSVALGLPGLGLLGYFLVGAADGQRLQALPVVTTSLLAAPILVGARMIALGYRLESRGEPAARLAGSPRRRVAVTSFGLLLATFFAGAALVPSLCACSSRRAAYYAAMKSDLKNLASQEEIYFSDHDVYTTDLTALGFIASYGVVVKLSATDDGWTANTTHVALERNAGCAIYYGDVVHVAHTGGGLAPSQAGEIACDPRD